MAKKKKRAKRPQQGQGPGITKGKYDQIFRNYLKDQSVKNVAKKCRLDQRTVRKYVDHGDPRRGFAPIRDRFASIIRKAQDKEDSDLAKAATSNLSLVRKAKKVLFAKLSESFSPDGETLTAQASAELPADPAASIERLVRLEMSLLGEPDIKVETTSRFEGWSKEDLIAYGATGKRPRGKR